MSITLVHHFHTEVAAVEHISPGWYNSALGIENRLVEVKAVQVEGHGANTQ